MIIDKKKTGEFYTPDKVAELLAELLFEGFDPKLDSEPRILDPSCGDGQLLVAVFLKVFDIYSPLWSDKEKLRYHIAEKMIYGMDIDPLGIEKSKARIFELSGAQPNNFICCDFLMEDGAGFKRLEGSFTHIIGNPPYIGHKNLELEYKVKLKEAFPGIYENKTDILSCFFPGAMKLLKENGKTVFITSRYYLEAPTYKGLREYIQENCGIDRIIDFDYLNVFRNARVASCITILRKRQGSLYRNQAVSKKNQENSKKVVYDRFTEKDKDQNIIEIDGFGDFYRIFLDQVHLNPKGWNFPTAEEAGTRQFIEAKANYSLADIFSSYQGIITGCDKAFVVKNEDDIQNWTESEKALLRPWIKNSFVQKFVVKEQNYRLIHSDGIKDISQFPNIEARFSIYRDKLENRRETKKKMREWYQLQWGRVEDVFMKRKIVHPYKASGNRFAIDENGNFCSADVYLMVPKEGFEPYLEYLTAVLNTDLYERYFKSFGKRMGGKIFDYYPNKVMEMRVYIPEDISELEEINKYYRLMANMIEVEVKNKVESETESVEKANGKEMRATSIGKDSEAKMAEKEALTQKIEDAITRLLS